MNSFIAFVPLKDCPVSLDTILNFIERKLRHIQEDEDIREYVGEWVNNWIITPFTEC